MKKNKTAPEPTQKTQKKRKRSSFQKREDRIARLSKSHKPESVELNPPNYDNISDTDYSDTDYHSNSNDDDDIHDTTFQKQMKKASLTSAFNTSTNNMITSFNVANCGSNTDQFFEQISEQQAEKNVILRLQQMEKSGNKVLNTLTKVFGGGKLSSNWHSDGGTKDVKQILMEAEADQKYKRLKRNSRIIIQISREKAAVLPRTIIHPESEWRSWWDVFMMILVSYYAIVTPINIAFDKSPFDVVALEILFNTFFVMDIILQFFTSYKHTKGPKAGRLEPSHKKIIENYLKGWFIIDVLASFPIDIILKIAHGGDSGGATLNRLLRLVRSVKLMRILRMSRIWKRLLVRARLNPSLVRLCKLFCFLLIEWHWIGCTYWAIAVGEGFTETNGNLYSDSWTPPKLVNQFSFGSQYIRAYFWAVMVTTGVGKDIIPTSDTQFIFTTIAIIVGVLMYALIVGSVGTALSSIDTPDSQRRRRMDAVREYLRQRDISEELTEKVLNYYDYCYTRHISQHDEKILEDIHSALKEKLDLEMNQQLLQKVPRFKQLPDAILLTLIHSLISRIYLPNELVYMIGERASETFFVARGDLEELDSTGKSNGFLSDGAFFGDQLFQHNARRTSTIRCITHCELLILTKSALRKIMKLFPEFAMMVQKWSGQQKWQSLKGWQRVQYAVKTTRVMRIMGANIVRFQDVMKHLNNVQDENNPLNILKNDHKPKLLQSNHTNNECVDDNQYNNEVSYDAFKDQYAAAFTQVHEEMERNKKRKEKLRRIRQKKLKQQKNGGKLGDILGVEGKLNVDKIIKDEHHDADDDEDDDTQQGINRLAPIHSDDNIVV